MALSLTTARQKLALETGPSGVFTATAGSTTTATCTAAFQSTELPASALAYAWVFVPGISTTNRQRRVKADGLNASTGVITLDGALGGAIANGTVIEITTVLPSVRDASASNGAAWIPGLHECLNRGLDRLLVTQSDYALALTNGQYDYPLPAFLNNRPERLLRVLQLNATGTGYVDAAERGHAWEVREGANGSVLHFVNPYRFSGSFSNRLVVRRPASGFIRVGGTWGDSTIGLVNESDECGVDLDELMVSAKVFTFLAQRDTSANSAEWERWDAAYRAQLEVARALPNYDRPAPAAVEA